MSSTAKSSLHGSDTDITKSDPLNYSHRVMNVFAVDWIYERVHRRLRSERTIMKSVLERLLDIRETSDPEEVGSSIESVEGFLSARLKDIRSVAEKTVTTVRLVNPDQLRVTELERLMSTFVTSAVVIASTWKRLSVFSGVDTVKGAEVEPVPSVEGEDVVVCRICNTEVLADLLEEHTQSCIGSYQSEQAIENTDMKIRELECRIGEEVLNVKWPGDRETMTNVLGPAIHLRIMLERALSMDPHVSETVDELHMIWAMCTRLNAVGLDSYIADAARLVNEKIKSSTALGLALMRLRQTQAEPMSDRSLQLVISDFRFIKKISRGMYGTVFLAMRKSTDDVFAIKATPRNSLKQKNQVRRILTEKDILLQFNNPYIVKFFYSIIGEQNLYLVTEFVPGGDLYSLLQNIGALEESAAKAYALQILLALRYLRENGIIHRDIKPDNILVAANGGLKLTDFGLSYVGMVNRRLGIGDEDEDSELNKAKSLVGTPDYIAPEIIMNHGHSFPVDYWSLGVMIYEFIYGTQPFHGNTEHETSLKILSGHIDFDGQETTPEFRDLISKLLTIDPSKRIGARSIDDIFAHPWFAGLDPESITAPFVPELASQTDTGYFQQRYNFNSGEDAALLADLDDQSSPGSSELYEGDFGRFPSMSLDSLKDANMEVAKAMPSDRKQVVIEEIEDSPLVQHRKRRDKKVCLPRPKSMTTRPAVTAPPT